MPLERLGPYRITRLLGRGGMGAVYEGVHEQTGERTAIKILSFAFADDSAFRSRFEAEIEMLKQLRHPNIVQLKGYGEQDGVLFYSMELVPGQNLHELLARGMRFTWREVADIAVQVCSALKHAHDHGVIHRDLKPANLLRTPDGQIKLTDFGIAKFFGATHLTSAGGVIGTADYMSPEQAEGQGSTARSDLYSLGAVLYTLLAGKPPFPGRSVTEILERMRHSEPVPIRRLDPNVPEEFEEIILQLLSRDPQQRIATPLALSKRVRAMLHALAGKDTDLDDETAGPDAPTRVLDDVEVSPPRAHPHTQQATRPTPPPDEDSQWEEHTVVTSPSQKRETRATVPSEPNDSSPPRFTEVGAEAAEMAPRVEEVLASQTTWRDWLSIAGLVLALLAIVAVGWYLTRPPDADTLYAQIQELAAEQPSEQLDGRVRRAIDDFLQRFPQDARRDELQTLKADHAAHWLWRRLEREARRKGGAEYLEPVERQYVEAMRSVEPNPKEALAQFAALADREATDDAQREIVQAAQHMRHRLASQFD